MGGSTPESTPISDGTLGSKSRKAPLRRAPRFHEGIPKDHAVVNYYAVVFLLPPPPTDLLRHRSFFERKNVCNSQENGVRTRCAAIANHYSIVNLLRRVIYYGLVFFSTAGSFGISPNSTSLRGFPRLSYTAFPISTRLAGFANS